MGNSKCLKCGSKNIREEIDRGIRQEVFYKNGYIVKEITHYKKDEGKAFCEDCKSEIPDFDL